MEEKFVSTHHKPLATDGFGLSAIPNYVKAGVIDVKVL